MKHCWSLFVLLGTWKLLGKEELSPALLGDVSNSLNVAAHWVGPKEQMTLKQLFNQPWLLQGYSAAVQWQSKYPGGTNTRRGLSISWDLFWPTVILVEREWYYISSEAADKWCLSGVRLGTLHIFISDRESGTRVHLQKVCRQPHLRGAVDKTGGRDVSSLVSYSRLGWMRPWTVWSGELQLCNSELDGL